MVKLDNFVTWEIVENMIKRTSGNLEWHREFAKNCVTSPKMFLKSELDSQRCNSVNVLKDIIEPS